LRRRDDRPLRLVSTGLTGSYQLVQLQSEPSAIVYALWEHENAYTDSLGTMQGDHTFFTGRASGGGRLIYPLEWTSTVTLAPYLGLYGDYGGTIAFGAELGGIGANTQIWTFRGRGSIPF
jgi:hypothetical protein